MAWTTWLGYGFHGNCCNDESIIEIENIEDIPNKLAELLKKYKGEPLTEISIRLDMASKHKLYPEFSKD